MPVMSRRCFSAPSTEKKGSASSRYRRCTGGSQARYDDAGPPLGQVDLVGAGRHPPARRALAGAPPEHVGAAQHVGDVVEPGEHVGVGAGHAPDRRLLPEQVVGGEPVLLRRSIEEVHLLDARRMSSPWPGVRLRHGGLPPRSGTTMPPRPRRQQLAGCSRGVEAGSGVRRAGPESGRVGPVLLGRAATGAGATVARDGVDGCQHRDDEAAVLLRRAPSWPCRARTGRLGPDRSRRHGPGHGRGTRRGPSQRGHTESDNECGRSRRQRRSPGPPARRAGWPAAELGWSPWRLVVSLDGLELQRGQLVVGRSLPHRDDELEDNAVDHDGASRRGRPALRHCRVPPRPAPAVSRLST